MSTQIVTGVSSISASKPAGYRLESIDLLRGLLMLLMALDHTRDFFSVPTGDPGDPLTSWPALFATRWITHLCAPGFIALAGISVYLQRRRGKSAEQMTRMLLTRGVWLIVLEVTVVSFAWAFSPSTYLGVIWAIGVSMICLGLLQRLSRAVAGTIGISILLLHNLLAERRWLPQLRGFLEVYGRVPLFYYVLHLYLLHSTALLLSVHAHLNWHYFVQPRTPHGGDLAGWGLSLPLVYCVWLGVILALYLPCWWFGRLKARRHDWWLSYL